MKSLSKHVVLLAAILLFTASMASQYLDDNGEVLKDKIIEDLRQFPDASVQQRSMADSLVGEIHREINRHPALQDDRDLKMEGLKTLSRLMKRLGDFAFLRGSSELSVWEQQRKLDTISAEVLAIESQIEAINDSLYALYSKLIDITQRGDEETRATKEKAALMIGKSPFYDHIKYIFDNESRLNFGLLMDERGQFIDDCWGCEKSGLSGLTSGLSRNERRMYRWRVMPFLIEHFGRQDYFSGPRFPWEFSTFSNLIHNYQSSHLLLEFMRANAEDPDSPVYKHLMRYYSDE